MVLSVDGAGSFSVVRSFLAAELQNSYMASEMEAAQFSSQQKKDAYVIIKSNSRSIKEKIMEKDKNKIS